MRKTHDGRPPGLGKSALVGLLVAEMMIAGCGAGGGGGQGKPPGTTATPLQAPPPPVPSKPPEDLVPAEVGTLPGELGVSGGSATYTLPIEVPAGPRGMQPNVSLSYASSRGYGTVGVGWSLAPRSLITRCPKSYADHGITRGAVLDTTDSFCLDGELMWTTAGNGLDGADYRLRVGRAVKITGVGSTDTIQSGFEVRPGDGSVRFYGAMRGRTGIHTNGTTINNTQAAVARPVTWLLREERDAYGNRIVYDYDPSENAFVLTRISYGFVDGEPTRTVDFEYRGGGDTPYAVRGWHLGVASVIDRPLSRITTRVHGDDVYTYKLSYGHGVPSEMRERLTSVTKCVRDGAAECLPPTELEYTNLDPTFTALEDHPYTGAEFPMAEIVPHSWTDLHHLYEDHEVIINGEEYDSANALHVLDANGDGKADLMARTEAGLVVDHTADDVTTTFHLRRPTRWYGWGYESSPTFVSQSMAPARTDEALSYVSKIWGTTNTLIVPQTEGRVVTALPTFTGRFNRDALDDVIEPRTEDLWPSQLPGPTQGSATGFHVLQGSKGPDEGGELGFLGLSFAFPDADTRPVVSYIPVDADGDGLNDLLFCRSNGFLEPDDGFTRTVRAPGHWHILMNEGGSFWDNAQEGGQSLGIVCDADDLLHLVDFDGDGRTDPLIVSVRDESFNKIAPWNWTNYQAFLFEKAGNSVTVTRKDTGLPPDKFQRYLRSRQRAKCHWFSGDTCNDGNKEEHVAGEPWWRDHIGSPTHVGGLSDDKIMDVNGDGLRDIVRLEKTVAASAEDGGELLPTATEAHPGADRMILEGMGASLEGLSYPDGYPDAADAYPHLTVWFNTGRGFTRGGAGTPQRQTYWRFPMVIGSLEKWYQTIPFDLELDGKEELLGGYPLGQTEECFYGVNGGPVDCDDYAKVIKFDVSDWQLPEDYAGHNARRINLNQLGEDEPLLFVQQPGPTADYDGDGVLDLLDLAAVGTGAMKVWRRNAGFPDLLVKATNGVGHVTEVRYATGLEARSHEAPEGLVDGINPPVGTPLIRGFSTGPLVRWRTEYTEGTDDPADQKRMTTYHYSDLRVDLYRRMAPFYKVVQSQMLRFDHGIHDRTVSVQGNLSWNSVYRDYEQSTPSVRFTSSNYEVFAPVPLSTPHAMAATLTTTRQRTVHHGGIWISKMMAETKQEAFEVPIEQDDVCAIDAEPCGPARLAGLQPVRRTVTTIPSDKIDAGGMPLESRTVTADRTTITTYEWDYYGEPWVFGALRRTTVADTFGTETSTRTTELTYNDRGAIESTIREPDRPEYRLEATRIYDDFGNPSSLSATAGDGSTRFTFVAWDDDHVFPTTIQNGLGHETTRVWDSRLGVVTEVKRDAGFSDRVAYDDFGRARWARAFRNGIPTGAGTLTDVEAPGADAHPRARVRIRNTIEGAGVNVTDVDALGRTIYRKTVGFGGEESYTTAAYDGFGRFVRRSLPAFVGQPAAGSSWSYFDARGRKTADVNPDGTSREYQYGSYAAPFTTWWRDENQAWHRSVGDVHGMVQRTLDGYASNANGGPSNSDAEMCFLYGEGARVSYTAPCNSLLNPNWDGPRGRAMAYDLVGRLTEQHDPVHGTALVAYTGFDELKTVTAAGHSVHSEYDIIGRRRVRRVYECPGVDRPCDRGSGQFVGEATWDYDVKMIGALDKATGESGNTEEPFYDDAGRVERVSYGIKGETFDYGFTYDALGRPLTTSYPVGAGHAPVVVQHEYDDFGVLSRVFDANNPAQEYWHLGDVDAAGRIRQEALGNLVWNRFTFDPLNGDLTEIEALNPVDTFLHLRFGHDDLGNVTSREDLVFDQSESFLYDERNRLYHAETTTDGDTSSVTLGFDDWGNIRDKNGDTWVYDGNLRLSEGAGVAYDYDDFGRALTRVDSDGKTKLAWSWFNKPLEMETPGGDLLRFDYDAALGRVAKESAEGVTIYAGGRYQRHVAPNTDETHTYTITAGGRPIAQLHREVVGGTAIDQVRYLSGDHLGSTSLVTAKDGQGNLEVLERPSFDAWGKPRSHLWASPAPLVSEPVSLGFTGHQAELEGGVMNMRGRFYDPAVGRFLSPDPVVQAPTDLRSHNPYSYLWNNPLNNTDPTGFYGNDVPPPPPLPPVPPDGGGGIDGTEGWTPCGPMACPPGDPMDPGSQGATTQTPTPPPPKPVTTVARDVAPAFTFYNFDNDVVTSRTPFIVDFFPTEPGTAILSHEHAPGPEPVSMEELTEQMIAGRDAALDMTLGFWKDTFVKPLVVAGASAVCLPVAIAYGGYEAANSAESAIDNYQNASYGAMALDVANVGLEVFGAVTGIKAGPPVKVPNVRPVVQLGGRKSPRLYNNHEKDKYVDEVRAANAAGVRVFAGKSAALLDEVKDGEKVFMYVVKPGGHVILAPLDATKHAVLGGGKPVLGAGRVHIGPNGVVSDIDTWSGHYQPTDAGGLLATKDAFGKAGFDVSKAELYQIRDGMRDRLIDR